MILGDEPLIYEVVLSHRGHLGLVVAGGGASTGGAGCWWCHTGCRRHRGGRYQPPAR
jgi:hypothetical protein